MRTPLAKHVDNGRICFLCLFALHFRFLHLRGLGFVFLKLHVGIKFFFSLDADLRSRLVDFHVIILCRLPIDHFKSFLLRRKCTPLLFIGEVSITTLVYFLYFKVLVEDFEQRLGNEVDIGRALVAALFEEQKYLGNDFPNVFHAALLVS